MVVVEVVAGTADVARALSAGAIAVGMRVVLFRRVGVRPARVHARLSKSSYSHQDDTREASRAFVKRRLFVPIVTLGLDDMKMAYRMINASRRSHITSLVAWFSFVSMCLMVQLAPGHFFGVKAANNNFSRVPRLACHVAALFFLICVFHYVDDFMNVDPVVGKRTAHEGLALILKTMGYSVEPSKNKKNGLKHKAIGAITDLSRVQKEQTAEVSPDLQSVGKMLTGLRKMKAAGRCKPSEAENVVGKCRWFTSQLRARAGTAALQPFAQRLKETKTEWLEEMDHSLEFLETVFDPEFIAKIEIKAHGAHRRRRARQPHHVHRRELPLRSTTRTAW